MAFTKVDICNLALSKIGNERNQLTNPDFTSNSGVIFDQCNLQYTQTLHQLVRLHSWGCCKARKQLSNPILTVTEGDNIIDLTLSPTDDVTTVNSERRVNRYTATDRTLSYDGTKFVYPLTVFFARNDDDICQDAELNLDSSSEVFSSAATTSIEPPKTTYTGPTSVLEFSSITVSEKKPIFEYDHIYQIPSDCVRALYLTNEKDSYNFLKPKVDWIREGNTILTNHEKIYLCYEAEPLPENMDSLFREAFTTLLAHNLTMSVTGDKELSILLLEKFNTVIMPEARRINGFEESKMPTIDSEWLESAYISDASYNNSNPPFSSSSYGTF
tara:strand:+ start:15187 stop:16173 length:987 start_codon:yes stop_codon:yes gene_type:complete